VAQSPNVPYSISIPSGAPQDFLGVTMFLTQFGVAINGWVKLAANILNNTWTTAPAHDTSKGTANQLATDGSYLYVCTATNTWKRVAIGGSW